MNDAQLAELVSYLRQQFAPGQACLKRCAYRWSAGFRQGQGYGLGDIADGEADLLFPADTHWLCSRPGGVEVGALAAPDIGTADLQPWLAVSSDRAQPAGYGISTNC